MPIDPPLLSDHAFVVIADYYFQTLTSSDVPPNFRQVRNWCGINMNAFAADLMQSTLVVTLPDNVVAAFECYNATLFAQQTCTPEAEVYQHSSVGTLVRQRVSHHQTENSHTRKEVSSLMFYKVVGDVARAVRVSTSVFRVKMHIVLAINCRGLPPPP